MQDYQNHSVPSGAYLSPYLQSDVYEQTRPRYVWHENRSEEEIIYELLQGLVQTRSDLFSLVVELGCGTGRFTQLLANFSKNLVAIDPSASMVSYCRQLLQGISSCKIYQASAEKVVASGIISKVDLVAAFWSLSYPLQSFLELRQGVDGNIIQQVSNEDAENEIQLFLSGLFQENATRIYIIIFFDEKSEEQTWVTNQWLRLAPLPGGGRDFIWLKLENYLDQLSQRGHSVKIETIKGVLVCDDEEHLTRVFLDHHLRGMIPIGESRCGLREKLVHAMDSYRSSESEAFHIPSSFRLVQVEIFPK
jgi:SAM-dependent methyltransferase